MSSFRKLTKKYKFYKKKSRRYTLLKGSFIPLDVVRLTKNNNFHTSKDTTSNLTIQERPSKTVIDETDSETDKVDFVDEKNQVNLDDESALSEDNNKECQLSKAAIEEEKKTNILKLEITESDNDDSLYEITDTYGMNRSIGKLNLFVRKDLSVDTNFKNVNNCENVHPNLAEDPEIKSKIETSMKHFKYQTTSKEKEKLAKLAIKTRYPILAQHEVESTAGTRILTAREIANFIKYAPLKQGNFNNTEDERIKENWKSFCEDNHWDRDNPKPFLFMKHKNKEFLMFDLENRKRFVQCLAHNLPDRSLYNVFHRFKILFDPHKKERYTEEEDKTILQFMSTYLSKKTAVDEDRPYADLAAILNRTRDSVWRRYNCVLKKNK